MPVSYLPSIASHVNATAQTRRRVNQIVSSVDTAQAGLTTVQNTLATGVSGTVILAKITGGGNNGSLTIESGIITQIVEPT